MYTLSQHIKHRLLFIRLALLGFLMLIATAAMAQGGGSTPHVTIGGSVFGGGNLADVGRNSTVTIDQANATMTDVYGGGALANVGTSADDTTTVNILQGHISGNVYGGGLGDSTATGYDGNANVAALVHGKVFVNIGAAPVALNTTPTGNAIINGSVFGCNNINGTPLDSVFVNIYKTAHTTENTYPTAPLDGWTAATLEASYATPQEYALTAVYGGGNKASYKPSVANRATTVHIYYCSENTIETAYGGGNAADVGTPSKHANTRLIIDGGCYDRIFGGGNGFSATGNHNNASALNYNPGANIYGTATTEIHAGLFKQVFGGSNQYGSINTVNLNIDKDPNCDQMILESFCGGNEADMVGTDINTTILCSDINIGTLYGGSNKAHILKDGSGNGGNVTLTVLGGNYDYVFGGSKGVAGSPANIAGNVTLNLHGGTIHEAAFGGSDVNGNILGSITVNVLDTVHGCHLTVDTIYGGGRDAAYTPTNANIVSPSVNVQHCTIKSVFGGGKGSTAVVTANPMVIIGETSTINDSHGDPIDTQAIVTGDVYGGGDAGNVEGTPQVVVANKCNTSIGYVYGGGNAADVSGTNVTINGGTVVHDVFGGGHGDRASLNVGGETGHSDKVANVNGNVSVTVTGGMIDRVFAGSNINGTVTGTSNVLSIDKSATAACDLKIREVYGGGNLATGNAASISVGCTGTLVSGDNGQAAHPENIGTSLEGIGTVYGGANQADIGTSSANSNITLNINNGMVANVFGGNNTSGDIHGTIQVNINKTSDACGWYVGDVFGGGNVADYGGTPDVNIIAGTVSGSVFGGGNAADVAGSDVEVRGGQINGGVYGGCNAEGDTGPVVISLNGGQVGADADHTADVFGGGFGQATTTSDNIIVTLGNTTVYGDIYGGSAFGSVNASASNGDTITINGNNKLYGTIYGGGKGSNEGSGTTALTNGNVVINYNTANTGLAGLYGGANVNGNVKGDITVNVNANVGANESKLDIFGGGYGAATKTEGNVTVTIGDLTGTKTPTIYGDIYGGSALGNVNDAAGDITKVDFLNGTLHGNIFGGGLGDKEDLGSGHSNVAAKVNGEVQVNVSSATQTEAQCHIDLRGASIYGCNNTNGSPQDNVTVNIYKTGFTTGDYESQLGTLYAIDQVFGGGKNADYLPENGLANSTKVAKVHVHDCDNTIRRIFSGGDAAAATGVAATIDGGRFDYIFGGGNGEVNEANIGNGGTNLEVHAGIINYLFGGSNTSGTIFGQTRTSIDHASSGCPEEIGEFFGGGNLAPISTSITTTLNCGVGTFDAVYGGSNAADITGDVTLTIKGGTITNVFGGSKGVQNGTAANITGNVTLNILSGTVRQAFGGSNFNGNITGKITVNVLDTVNSCQLQLDTVYGSGNLTPYTPTNAEILSPEVNVLKGVVNDVVFGGGKGETAIVTANPTVTIGDLTQTGYEAIVNGKVFGGGNAAAVQGNTSVLIQQSHSIADTVFGGGNLANVSGSTVVNVNGGTVHYDVYGGGALADVGGSTVTLGGGTVRNLYGGGLGQITPAVAALVNGPVQVTVNNGTVTGSVYGCNNLNGAPQSTVQVDIKGGTVAQNVFGGGNLAAYTGTPEVNVTAGTVGGSVFGGGNEAGVGGGDVNVSGGQINTGVYGGCNTSGTVSGDITVNVKSGVIGTQANLNSNILANVFGGGFGPATTTSGNVEVNIDSLATLAAPVIYGDVYGGSALGNVNDAATDRTVVNVVYGTLKTHEETVGGFPVYHGGNVFGGGLGRKADPANSISAAEAKVYGTVTVNIGGHINTRTLDPTNDTLNFGNAFIEGNVYGCNNTNGSPQDSVTVNIYRTHRGEKDEINYVGNDATYALHNVFGGGNEADYIPAAGATNKKLKVYIHGCYNSIERVFGGSNAAAAGATGNTVTVHTLIEGGRFNNVFGGGNGEVSAANIVGDVDLEIHGGMVEEFYVGSNQNGTITGNSNVVVDQNSGCESVSITEFYCGGKYADFVGDIEATITCTQNMNVDNLYGGCKEADVVAGNGGSGNIHLIVKGGNYVNVYGGSRGKRGVKAANIEGNVTLDLYGGTMENVFGGSNENGNIAGTITVNIIDEEGSCPLNITNIYGGSNETDYEPTEPSATSPVINLVHINSGVQGNIFGGSKGLTGAAEPTKVVANPRVNIGYDSSMTGLPPTSTYNPASYSQRTAVSGNVFGGGDAATVNGSTEVFLRNRAKVFGNVYGGGNLGEVSGNTRVIVNGQNQ